jgi:sterol 3beta-glucosyltransferase
LKSTWDNCNQTTAFTHHDSTEDNSPSLSISDLYDADFQPITIPASNPSTATVKRSNSVVANALAFKDFIYPSITSSTKSSQQQEDSSSSTDEDDTSIGWLDGKRRSGMKLVYGLLGGNTTTPDTSMDYHDEDEDDEDEDDEELEDRSVIRSPRADGAEILDDRTMTNFQKYFVLPASEKLLTGKLNITRKKTKKQTDHPL